MRSNNSKEPIILMPTGACTVAELEVLLDIVGEAATRLKKRLDLIYGQRKDDDGRKFSGLHETVLPLCSKHGPFSISCGTRLQREPPGSV